MDKAYNWTTAELKRLEKKIKDVYTKAYYECRKEASEVIARIAAHPEWDGARRLVEMNKYERLDKMSAQMGDTLKNASDEAVKYIKGEAVNVFRGNYNWQAKEFDFAIIDNTAARNILAGISNPFTKLSYEAVKDKAAMQRALQSELTTGLLRGEGIPDIARRIKTVTEKPFNECVKIARTETTYAQNSARHSVGEQGKKMGFKMQKEWRATEDGKTRDAHQVADGQRVPIDEPFIVGGEELMFPGDFSMGASPWNIISCRCTAVYIIDK